MPAEALLDLIHDVMASPWIYLALYLIAAVDAFFPVVPSESAVITAGAFAASGEPVLLLVMTVAALGACTGDHLSYGFGRSAGRRLVRRLPAGGRRRDAYDRSRRALARRGGLVLVVARYVPGGRTAVTLTMGAVGYPARRFTGFDVLAAVSWAVYSGLLGYLGGLAFEREPWKGVLLGLGFAVSVTVLVEVLRLLRRRRTGAKASGGADPSGDTADAEAVAR